MAYVNQNGQVRIGVRSGLVNTPVVQPAFSASLLQSIYGIWNGDTNTTELDKSLFGVWNAENSTNTLDTNIYSVFTDTTTYTHPGVTSSQFGLWNAEGLGLNDKVGTNHLTSFGSATFSTDAIIGTKSFTFNGSNYFGLPVNSWNFTGDFSLSFWVKSNWPGSGGVIPISNSVWVQTSPTIKYSGWDIRTSGPFPIFYGVSGGTTSFYIQSTVQCVNNVWSNVVVTKSDSVVSIYVNGLLGGTSSVTGNINYATTSYPTIGAQKYSSAGVSDYIGNGSKIDDVAVWTRTLSHDDVIQIYNSGSGQSYPYTQPVSISVDKSQSLKGFVIGTGSSVVSGKTGNAISLTQSSSIILKDRSALKFTGDFSVSFWFRTSDVTTGKALISTSDGTKGWWIYIASGNILWYSGGSANVNFGFNPTTLVANTWYHVVVSVANNVDISCYLNGVLGGYQSMVSKTITYDYWNGFHPSVIGGRANRNVNNSIEIDYRFTGTIDDIVTWNRKLTLNEVNQLYNGTSGVEYPYSGKSLSSPNDNFGTNHGTLMNGCSFAIGKIGNAFTFDGVNDYVSFPTDSWNSLVGTDLTISLWVKFASTGNQTLISNMSAPGVNIWNGWEIRISSGQPIFYSWNNTGNTNGVIGSSVTTNTWYHIVATKRGNSYKIYMNGSLTSTGSGTGNAIVNASFYPNIGHLQYSSSFHANYTTNGTLIDAVNLWNREITADEVTQLYNSGTGAQYPFTGTFSSAGNQLGMDNGTLVNGCSLTTGKVGQAFTFDEVNDYVSLPNNSLNFTGDFSVNFWVYTNISFRVQFFFSNYSVGSTYGYGYYCSMDNGKMTLTFINGGTHESSYQIPYTWTQNWHHVVITRKRSTSTKVYINGSIVSGTFTFGDVTKNPSYQANQICNIGGINNGTSNLLNGKIDSFTTWQKELTQAEVTELYNSGNGKQITATPIVQTGLILNLDASRKSSYPNTGSIWYDISGNGKNGTLTNGPIFGTANEGSISFDGINDCIDFGDVLDMGTKSYTINMWIKLNSNSSIYQTFLSKALAGQQNYRFAVGINNYNKLYAFLQGNTSGSDVTPSGTISLPLNTWFMATFIFDRSSSISIYYNGVNDVLTSSGVISQWSGLDFQSNNPFRIGSYTAADNSTPISMTSGLIGITQVYDRVLSQVEITQNFNATKSRFGL